MMYYNKGFRFKVQFDVENNVTRIYGVLDQPKDIMTKNSLFFVSISIDRGMGLGEEISNCETTKGDVFQNNDVD